MQMPEVVKSEFSVRVPYDLHPHCGSDKRVTTQYTYVRTYIVCIILSQTDELNLCCNQCFAVHYREKE